jgi:hypothetical protein
VTASTGLSFSDDELTFYARVNGRRRFPNAVDEDLGDAGWEAVARGLAARGVLRDGPEQAFVPELDAVLRPVLLAERMLRVLRMDARVKGGDDPVARLWRHGDRFVSELRAPDGPRSFTPCERDAVDVELAEVLEITAGAQSDPAEPQSVVRKDMTAAFELLIGGDLAAAMARTPAAAGFVEAYADARYVVEITSTRIVNYDFYDDILSLLVSEQHGLWVDGEDFTADPDGTVRVQRVAPETAGALVARLFGTFA